MLKRLFTVLFRWLAFIATGVLVGEGCIGPNDLRSQFVTSFNSMVYRAMEVFISGLAGLPPEQ